ncbi:MAG: hypothetical protein GF350_03920 [Chitinivibrionales bacterium]|nr:hypothetical protein [Chitinivibrionales bacterium]
MIRKLLYAGIVGVVALCPGCTTEDTGPIGYAADATGQKDAVRLIAPEDQDRSQDVSVTLKWSRTAEPGVTYAVYLDIHDDPDSAIAAGLGETDTVLQVTGLQYATAYFWMVVTRFESDSTRSFIAEFSTVFRNMAEYNSENSGLANNRVLSIAVEGAGNAWIGTGFSGLQKFDKVDSWTTYDSVNSSLDCDRIPALAITADGKKWVGTASNNAFFTSDGGTFTGQKYRINNTEKDSINDSILTLATDSHGSIYIGARSRGACRLNDTLWIQYDTLHIEGVATSVRPYMVNAICIDRQANELRPTAGVYLGTNNGLYEITDTSITNLYDTSFAVEYRVHLYDTVYSGDSVSVIESLYNMISVDTSQIDTTFEVVYDDTVDGVQKTDTVYRGSELAEIDSLYPVIAIDTFKYDSTFNLIYTEQSEPLVDSTISSASEIQSFSLTNDILEVDTVNIDTSYDTLFAANHFNTDNGLPENMVTALACDESGNVWVGTWSNGVLLYDGAAWTSFTTSNSKLSNNHINALAVLGPGAVLAGTNGGGLAWMSSSGDGRDITMYDTGNSSIPSDVIYAIAIESSGEVWLGTNHGILIFKDQD